MLNEVVVRLSIFDADNDNITKLLELKPTRIVKKGDLVSRRGTIVYKHNIWSYEIKFKNIVHIEDVCIKFIKLLTHKKSHLISLGKIYDIEFSVSVYTKEGMPSIHLSKEVIDFVKLINAEIDIDML